MVICTSLKNLYFSRYYIFLRTSNFHKMRQFSWKNKQNSFKIYNKIGRLFILHKLIMICLWLIVAIHLLWNRWNMQLLRKFIDELLSRFLPAVQFCFPYLKNYSRSDVLDWYIVVYAQFDVSNSNEINHKILYR